MFNAITSSTTALQELVKTLAFASNKLVRVALTSYGVRLSVGSVTAGYQAFIFLDKAIFSTYSYNPPSSEQPSTIESAAATSITPTTNPTTNKPNVVEVDLRVSLHALLESLNFISGVSSSQSTARKGGGGGDRNSVRSVNVHNLVMRSVGGTCRMKYDGHGDPLILVVEQDGIVTTCEITTYDADQAEDDDNDDNEPDSPSDISLNLDAIDWRLIMKSEWLLDAMTELESVPSTQSLIVRVSRTRPYFRLSAKGPLGSAEMDYPNDRSVMETFVCTRPVQHAYNFAMVRHAMKSMQTASKVSVRTDDQGILSCQFMVEVSDKIVNFIEFRFLPNIDDDED